MLIYTRVGLILTPTTPPSPLPSPSPVTYSPSCAIFHSCSSAEQILRFSIIQGEFPIRLRRILQTLDARSRNSAPRDYVSEVGRFQMETINVCAFFIPDNREGMCENFRGILLATVALFLRNVYIPIILWRVEFFVCKLFEIVDF